MSKNNKLAKDIPDTEFSFTVDAEGDVTKKRFVGEFTCKIPRKKEQCMIDKHRAFLNGSQPEFLTSDTLKFHHMISYLRYTLIEYPKFWKETDLGYELYDESVVQAVYDKVLEFEVDWLKEVWGEEAVLKLQGKSESGSGEEEKETKKGK